MQRLWVLCACLPFAAIAEDSAAAVQRVATSYLDALTGSGDDSGRQSLLGGVTMNSELVTIGSWKIVATDPVRKETADLRSAVEMMTDLDRAGRTSIAAMLKKSGGLGDNVEVHELSQAEANQLLAPTREKAQRFNRMHPVLAYVARVDKPVYWHPKNPIRPLLAQAGSMGTYTVEVHRFLIESLEGPRQEVRRWPLRVVRFTTSAGLDTNWKILPASDWNGD